MNLNKIKQEIKMKTLLMTFLLVGIFAMVSPAQELRILKADTLSNGTTHTIEMYLGKFGTHDSIVVSIFASGEIDMDTMYIHGGLKATDVPYVTSNTDIDGGYELIEGADLTINLADGVEEIVEGVITLTAQELKGYNNLKFYVVGAAAGCDAGDDDQKYLLYVEIYRPIRYNKQL